MVYSDVIKNNWHLLLPKKEKYTRIDSNKVWLSSLFDNKLNNGNAFSENQARFITVCTAIFHNAKYSKILSNVIEQKYPIFNKI